MTVSTPAAAVTDLSTPAVAAAVRQLKEQGIEVLDYSGSEAASPDVRILVAGSETAIGSEVLTRLPALRLVVRTGAGYERIDVPGLQRHGVEVARASGRNVQSVAEYVYAGLLGLLRQIPASDTAVRTGDFAFRERVLGFELHGRTLGVLGYGPIGLRVAEIGAYGFGMRVLLHHPWGRHPVPDAMESVDELDEFLSRTDVLSIHCRLSEESRGLIGAEQLRLLGPQGYLVNAARGEIVDATALAQALSVGQVAGAVLDVFPSEPPDLDLPLFSAPNVLLSPHLAGHTTEGIAGNGRWAAGIVAGFLLQGRRPPAWSICSEKGELP